MHHSPFADRLHPAKVCLLVILAFAIVVVPNKANCAIDPWYTDVQGHWASDCIYVLWSEGVTDGQIISRDGSLEARFHPDLECSRAEFTVLMAKTFSLTPLRPDKPTYPDVPESYEFLSGKLPWEWIECASSAGMTSTHPGHNFYPDQGITRQDAVDLLVRSLGLYDYALAMAEKEVNQLLNRFKDGMNTPRDRRHSMACAIKFGIIEGYEDGTIRPKLALLRCHAAAVLYRSCLVRVFAEPDVVSPDGDGIEDVAMFSISYLKNRATSTWNMGIEDDRGSIVYTFNPQGKPGSPPHTLMWGCVDNKGLLVEPGTYYYQAWVRDRGDRTFFSVKKPLEVIYYSLSGYLFPTTVYDGQILTIVAFPEPSAKTVSGLFEDGKSRQLHLSETQSRWVAQLSVADFLPLGTQTVVVTAQFGDRTRDTVLSFERIDNLWISPYVSPNPIEPGQILELYCESSSNIDRVEAYFLGHQIDLKESGGVWHKNTALPADTLVGNYAIVFTGHSGNRQVTAVCYITVGTEPLKELVFTLTR